VATKRRCKPGRPKGSIGGGGGRRPKDLSHDPWRYLYAAAQLIINRSPIGMSELSICNAFAMLRHGRPLRDGEFLVDHHGETIITARKATAEEMRAGRPFLVVPRRWDDLPAHGRAALRAREPHHSVNGSWPYREANEFRPFSDNLRKRFSYLRKTKPTNLKHRHFAGLITLLDVCFAAPEMAEYAASVADMIGERSYWETTLRPAMARLAAWRAAGEGELPVGVVLFELCNVIFC
jgi:hypothetical protein